jgi:hypothetical protein
MNTLEERIAVLEREIQRLNSYNEIQRLMGKYMTCHIRSYKEGILSQRNHYLFFASRPDSSAEIADHGVYIGYDHIKKMYEDIFGSGPAEGVMFEHNLCSPQIVVADDGQTARGVWHCPGHETDPRMGEVFDVNAKPVATWVWGRIAADFIRENGEWKIWHYHWYRLFRCPFYKSWVDYQIPEKMQGGADKMPGYTGIKRDKPTTYFKMYALGRELDPVPPCPDPYATWTDDRPPV